MELRAHRCLANEPLKGGGGADNSTIVHGIVLRFNQQLRAKCFTTQQKTNNPQGVAKIHYW